MCDLLNLQKRNYIKNIDLDLEAHERKLAKYQELVQKLRLGALWEPIKVGCRGFLACSTCKAPAQLRVTRAVKRETIRSTTEATEKATWWLLIKRVSPSISAAGMHSVTTPDGSPG